MKILDKISSELLDSFEVRNDEFQNVQRLEQDQNNQTSPKVLESLPLYDESLLQKREELIALKKTSGNNAMLTEYKKAVPAELSPTALSWCLGLVLSDATVQRNTAAKQTCRLKIQQAIHNKELLDVTLEILKPYVFTISHSTTRTTMYSLATIQHKAFNVLSEILQDPNEELQPGACVKKIIPENIIEYLDPITISAWFCGDGGKADYTPNQGKGIQFHTQGFSLECIKRLAQALRSRYSWEARAVFDYTNGERDFYYLQVDAASFNSVERILKAYILPSFLRRFPTPRSPNSRYLDR